MALQEIDLRRARAAHVDNPFEILQEALGNHGIGAKTVTTADGEYGQALISRWPMLNTRDPRPVLSGARAATGHLQRHPDPGGPLRVIATHLGLSLRERHSQAVALLKMLGSSASTTVALGDFNDWLWAGSVRRSLARALPGYTRHPTFPVELPAVPPRSHIPVAASALMRSWTDPEARAISDHLPVIADIRLVRNERPS